MLAPLLPTLPTFLSCQLIFLDRSMSSGDFVFVVRAFVLKRKDDIRSRKIYVISECSASMVHCYVILFNSKVFAIRKLVQIRADPRGGPGGPCSPYSPIECLGPQWSTPD